MGFFPKRHGKELETALVNEPSVFEALKFYCIDDLSRIGMKTVKYCLRMKQNRCDGWRDDLQFYVFFNSISVISQRWEVVMKYFVQWNSVYGLEDFASSGDRTRSARSVGQRLTH